jgi:putative hemolysin
MLANILSFADRKILQAMIPRSDVFAVDASQNMEAIITQVLSSRYSRVPVYRRSLDNIIGIIYTKDLTVAVRNQKLFLLDDIIRPAYFVPESAAVSNVLREFKQGRRHLAIVVDEYGTTSGLVTIEDLVEEIVGEIYDEYDVAEQKVARMPDGSWVVYGDETVINVNEKLNLRFSSPDATTINGFVLSKMGHIPQSGESLVIDNASIIVLESDSKRIKKLRIKKA